ncbi:MAG TPA: 3-hydroxyacyl-ACP dehydratase FabZ family protein [Bacteriovoracaceae bacterium]|nr:3-hydroxyacyl-ACP dehydratase FabZ family protein [Bacteriovoracaceae bacterium]
MFMDKAQVMRFLPHRDPFLFIDTVIDVVLPEALNGLKGPFTNQQIIGGTAVCSFKVDNAVPVLKGHFPGNPILPGVVQVEMMAQAASFLAIKTIDGPIDQVKIDVALLGVDAARFRKPIIPPMDLEIRSKLVKMRGPIHIYECEIRSKGELISNSTVMASLKIEQGK